MTSKKTRIILSGGGTMGSVSPLLAIVETWRASGRQADFLWIGTDSGPERKVVEKDNIAFKSIKSGKFRRYLSWKNITDLWKIKLGFWQAFFTMLFWRPNLIITAGSFVSVPVAFAGWILHIPIIVHQLDYQAGLANKIMAKFAKRITTTFVKSIKDYGDKAVWIGGLARKAIVNSPEPETAMDFFGFKDDKPVLLILGGGTGSLAINNLLSESLEDLSRFCQIIHITGGRPTGIKETSDYRQFIFLNDMEMALAYSASDLVVSRAGMGTIIELAYLGKPTILIPMPNSHQELNAKALQGGNAVIVLDEKKLSGQDLINIVQEVIYSPKLLDQMSNNISRAFKIGNETMIEIIDDVILKK